MEIPIPETEKELRDGYIHLAARVVQLEEMLRLMQRGRFGASSEKLTHPGMRPLFPELEEDEVEAKPKSTEIKAHSRKPKKNRDFPADIPREEIRLEASSADKKCSDCQEEMVAISEKTSEKLHMKPAEMVVRKFIRPVYSCKSCETATTTPMPYHPIPRCSVTPETIADIIVSKYLDGMPLYRQEQKLKRHKIDIPRESMARWVCNIGEQCKPIKDEMHRILLAGRFVAMDETTLQVNKEKGREAHKKSYMLVQGREGPPGQAIALFHYEQSRAASVVAEYLQGFQGHLLTDGLEVYQALVRATPGIVHGGCWSHCRRKFVENVKGAKKPRSGIAADAIKLIGELFSIEDDAKTLEPQNRYALRQEKAKPVIDALGELLAAKIGTVPNRSTAGKALGYLHNQWRELTAFLEHPELDIHNNFIERTIRPFAVSRKAWLFADTVGGANASATLYSLAVTAKINGLNPYDYFCETLLNLNKPATELLPFAR